MSFNDSADQRLCPPRVRRLLVAIWISAALHAAAIALVRVAPPAAPNGRGLVIEARLVSPAAPPGMKPPPRPAPARAAEPAKREARLAPSAQAVPVGQQAPGQSAQQAPSAPAQAPSAAPAAPAAPATSGPETAQAATSPAAPAAGAAISSAVDLTYYPARDWGVPPRALRKIEPEYPDDADRQRLSGSVRLQLKLEEDGRISDIKVVGATPPGVFEESAVKAFRNVRFAPAQRNGQPVRALVLITVEFDWAGRH